MMKKAREEAESRIAKIRQEQEQAFQSSVSSGEGSGNLDTETINKNTQAKLDTLKSNVETNRDSVRFVVVVVVVVVVAVVVVVVV